MIVDNVEDLEIAISSGADCILIQEVAELKVENG
jgi:hypothetical protein